MAEPSWTDRSIHVHDLATETETEFPESKILQQRHGTRTILATAVVARGRSYRM